MESQDLITIAPIQTSDIDHIITFLKTYFFKDEPLNQHLKLSDCPELEAWARNFDVRCSFKATNQVGDIVGVITCAVIYKKNSRPLHNTTSCTSNYLALSKLFQYVDDRFNLFERFPECDRALETLLVSVDESYRGRGISEMLGRSVVEYMNANAIRLNVATCTNAYSTMACRRLGYDEQFALKYTDYIVDGTDPIRLETPHDAFRLFTKFV